MDGVPAGDLMRELLAAHGQEIERRGLLLRPEVDERLRLPSDPRLREALVRLLAFAFATVPDGCEVTCVVGLREARLADVAAGVVTLRWQVAGESIPANEGAVQPLRPLRGGAVAQLASSAAARVRRSFAAAGWQISLERLEGDELIARASESPKGRKR